MRELHPNTILVCAIDEKAYRRFVVQLTSLLDANHALEAERIALAKEFQGHKDPKEEIRGYGIAVVMLALTKAVFEKFFARQHAFVHQQGEMRLEDLFGEGFLHDVEARAAESLFRDGLENPCIRVALATNKGEAWERMVSSFRRALSVEEVVLSTLTPAALSSLEARVGFSRTTVEVFEKQRERVWN